MAPALGRAPASLMDSRLAVSCSVHWAGVHEHPVHSCETLFSVFPTVATSTAVACRAIEKFEMRASAPELTQPLVGRLITVVAFVDRQADEFRQCE